jgi:hypothetical protein
MNINEFYAQNPERQHSGEADYGVWWLNGQMTYPRYRISYIHATGEVYVINQNSREVEVLGVVKPDDDGDYNGRCFYVTLDKILDGWADKCGQPNGLQWVKERLHRCEVCGGNERMLESRPICWYCNDEARREEAIGNRAEERGQRY